MAARWHFPSDKAPTQLIRITLRNVERKWKAPPPFRRQARREFAILFGDRFQVLPR